MEQMDKPDCTEDCESSPCRLLDFCNVCKAVQCQMPQRCQETLSHCPTALTLSMSDICCVIQSTPEVPGRPATSTCCPLGCFSASSLNVIHLQERRSWAWQQVLADSALLWHLV